MDLVQGVAKPPAASLCSQMLRVHFFLGREKEMWFAVIAADGRLIGLYTSRVDAALSAKPHVGSVVWSCRPNSDGGERIASTEVTVR